MTLPAPSVSPTSDQEAVEAGAVGCSTIDKESENGERAETKSPVLVFAAGERAGNGDNILDAGDGAKL